MALTVFVVIVVIIIIIIIITTTILSRTGFVVCYGLPYLILIIIPLKMKCNLIYIRTQSVPRCKHFPPRL